MDSIPIATTCILSERWPVRPFSGQFDDPRFRGEVVRYEMKFRYPKYGIEEEHNFTVVCLDHVFLWEGKPDDFGRWGILGVGGPIIAIHITDIVNRLIDLVQATFEETPTNPFPHIRRVGIRDFVALDSLYGERKQNLISYGAPALDGRIARRTENIVSTVGFSTLDEPLKQKTKLIRAVGLLNSGYHTEALIVAYSVLDDTVQGALASMLSDRGVKEPRMFLEAIPARRLKTYLDPVLKMLTGHSIAEDEPELWKALGKCNNLRNNALHEAVDMPYEKAKEGISTICDILKYLERIPRRAATEESYDTVLPQLSIDRLPFLLEDHR